MKNNAKSSILNVIEIMLEWITMIGFSGMLLATIWQVLFRYVLKISVPWTEELARILFILTMFLGIAIAIREDEHIVVDFLFKKINRRLQAFGQAVYNIAIFILLCFLARGTLIMTQTTWESYMISLEWIRTGYLYLIELIAIVLMMMYVVQKVIVSIKILRTGGPK